MVVALAPISFYVVQVRVADALLPLSMPLGKPAVVGFTVGYFIGNLFGLDFPFNLVDAILGSVANFLACDIGRWRMEKTKELEPRKAFTTTLIMAGVITLVVGTYLPLLLVACGIPLPFVPTGPIPPLLAFVLGGWAFVGLGTFLSVSVMGYLLSTAAWRALTRLGFRASRGTRTTPKR